MSAELFNKVIELMKVITDSTPGFNGWPEDNAPSIIAMKKEFKFDSTVPTNNSKHYFAVTGCQIGNTKPASEMVILKSRRSGLTALQPEFNMHFNDPYPDIRIPYGAYTSPNGIEWHKIESGDPLESHINQNQRK